MLDHEIPLPKLIYCLWLIEPRTFVEIGDALFRLVDRVRKLCVLLLNESSEFNQADYVHT